MENFMDFLSKKKTLLFLLMCLSVHAVYAVVFGVLGIFPLLILNIFSTVFYIMVLLLFKRNQDFYIGFTYFEIITFSLLSEIFSGGGFFYIFFVVGMISVIFYLLPPKTRLKHIYQAIGSLFAIAILLIYINRICLFPEYLPLMEVYKNKICFLNLCITLFTLFYISNLYFYELNTTSEKLAYTSNHDLLTGLFNRRFFEYIMERNKTENESEYTIAIFDIDDFKKINDTYGHQAGDAVLQTVSGIIGDCANKGYIPVRWGGEEFILFMPQTGAEKAYEYLSCLCEKVRNEVVDFDSKKIKITLTVGMCTGTDLINYESIIRIADSRLYTGKRSGKNRIVRA
ncbi:MAG: GGDEF domain-containing protein [Treponema sp.]|uniref:GGDEF domain-containing protein n=1 Tax=Treponema sp. TaxID=166 RepID=UPI0025D3B071|nr:GGDEF domain-containing protein [Treponema sp.]MBR0496371.1 GGDEF domain-containing protein [Treponema sp.]